MPGKSPAQTMRTPWSARPLDASSRSSTSWITMYPPGPPALGEQPSDGGVVGDRREHLEELVTDEQHRVAQPELGDAGVVEADLQAEGGPQLLDDRVEVGCDQCDLAQADHACTVYSRFSA
jgi:hypothetical protein